MLDTATNYIPPAPAPAATITVELTNEQIEALCEFASKGSDEWMHDRVACKEVFEPEEIEERNSLMDQCDAALANIRSAQNGSKATGGDHHG